ncbi:uncharacterized protein AC631_02932 [Debaryomyces fabryi]|uniref:DUF7907 domain-containing protein n=1 Tax=Debaryomyces fabryi TaxID=58627 RepID=A0A0V1PYG7_9ASCO|nr:uncharacterized protein AC631_02932 [Debaryomyces fabryi]KSA01300.1 hypothetical protein AC631_02932 [Debaryomyces fabryi]CUM46974.1 unnamed protein product [Debaryomyces fabryi]
MKISTICVAALAALAQASPVKHSIKDVKLTVESDNTEINGKGLSSLHEGAGLNYFFLGEGSQDLKYNSSDKQLYFDVSDDIKFSFSVSGNFATIGVLEPYKVEFEHNYLKVNGTTDGFFACKNVNDPYRYSENSYALMNYLGQTAPEGCILLKVKNSA